MRNYVAENVDQYIANAPKEAQATLRELRSVVRETIPEAEEGISWGVPFYKYHGLLGGFSSFTNHASFGLAFALGEKLRQILVKKGYQTGSKTIQIRFDQKVPRAEIVRMLKDRAALNEAKKGIKN